MSRIYRSLDRATPKVSQVDLRQQPMGPPRPDRPAGGFQGFGQAEGPHEVLSDLERRQRESLQLVEEARRQAETIQAEAWRAGFEEGERAGEKLARQKIEPVIQTFTGLLEALNHERENLIRQYERELIKVAFLMASRVLATTIEERPEVAAAVVRDALEKLAGTQEATLYLAPRDRQIVEQQMRKSAGQGWPPTHLKIESDESIARGGCRIATEAGAIDATIETQLHVLKRALWNE